MQKTSLARKAGIIGMVGAVFWIVSIIMEHGLGVAPSSGPLSIVNDVMSLTALISMNVGFLGLIWGGAFRGRFGTFAVGIHVFAYTLIVLGGIAAVLLGDAASPLFILFPIGGALEGPAQMMIAVAVLVTARWRDWQRWIPLLYSIYGILAVGLPRVLGVTPDGPGMEIEIGQGVCWFLVALAVYTAQARITAPQAAVGQA